MVNGSFEKSLRLVISYGHLKRAQFLDALQERLEPRLKKVRRRASARAGVCKCKRERIVGERAAGAAGAATQEGAAKRKHECKRVHTVE